ncbi:MAG TPA: tetratricopeptide repeat protein [Fimbriiglobus sp.]|nr:tetratricopeptide repeat protein [Fimbriiglobus sp.]
MLDLDNQFARAVAVHRSGEFAAAERMYRDLLRSYPAHTPALCNLGVLLVRAGRVDEAAECYNLALAATPGHPDAHFNLGNLYRRANRPREAAGHYRACLTANPAHAGAAFNLGLALSAVGDAAGAAESFAVVARLEPTNPDAHSRLGDALVRAGQWDEGVAAMRKAVELRPDDHRNYYNLGLALAAGGQTAEAQELHQRALQLKPDYAEAHNGLGLVLEATGRKDDALAHYQRAVELKPELGDAWSNLGTNLAEQGRPEEAIACFRESLARQPLAPAIHSNLLLHLNYSSRVTPEQVRDEHLAWAARFAGPTPGPPPVPEPHDPDRRMRIGYLSADFRGHTVAGFIETLLRHHDRERVEVIAYASIMRPDDTTEKLKALADHWRPVGGLTDAQAFDLIRGDNLDVLIDLGGHTAGNRLLLLAARPAPVQATLFGYPNTTGLKAVDYRITDPVSDPPGRTEHLYAESLLWLPETAWVYAPPTDAPPVTPLPQREFTFGCLNNSAKISDACLEAWAAVLQAVPDSRLVLLAGQSRGGAERLLDRFAERGVSRERVELVFRLPRQEYFATYSQFDLSLDPFPYNGGVSTGDSLWMGVPVLTVAGPSYVSRQGIMAMTTVGLPEFVAQSSEELVRLAKEWTNRREELTEIRAGLRDRLAKSPLADAPRYVRSLEEALRRVWRDRLP